MECLNTCGAAYQTAKVSEALCDMALQQPHIYFDIQMYIQNKIWDNNSAVLRHGLRFAIARLFIIT
jgi:hypothetical protein